MLACVFIFTVRGVFELLWGTNVQWFTCSIFTSPYLHNESESLATVLFNFFQSLPLQLATFLGYVGDYSLSTDLLIPNLISKHFFYERPRAIGITEFFFFNL